MFKFNKEKKLKFKHKNNTPLPTSNGRGEKIILRIKNIKSLFQVNYNKSAFSCNPCMDACKKINKKINGRKLSNVSNEEIKKFLKVFVSF